MKYVWRIAFIGVILSPVARAEVTMIKKKSAQLRAFQNYDEKIAALEDYTVAYLDGKKRTYVALKSAPARQTEKNEVNLELRPVKKKS